MSRWYPFHVSCTGPIRTPTRPNRWKTVKDENFFTSREEAVSWLREDMMGCTIAAVSGVAYLAEVKTYGVAAPSKPKIKRIKFVKKVKPASRWRPTWIATRENTIHHEGHVDDNAFMCFDTKKEALEYADRYCSRPYWRPGTPKEVK